MVVLLRHAQAEHHSGTPDEGRPLTLHGRRQCLGVAEHLLAEGLTPQRVLVSSALRTRQTWELVRTALGDVPAPDVEVTEALYDASVSDVAEMIRAMDDDVRTVLVVGHEPTMSSTAVVLASDEASGAEHLSAVKGGLRTGSFAVLELREWRDCAPGAATLRTVVRPAR